MKTKFLSKISLSLIGVVIMFTSCDEDPDDPVVEDFAAPTIAVTLDNDQPFQGDTVVFNISVSAEAGLNAVTLNGTEIKTYAADETSDAFSYEFIVDGAAEIGPTSVDFAVEDVQEVTESATFSSSITVQNSDFRGNPVILTDFQENIPNSVISELEWSFYNESWGAVNSWSLTHPTEDLTNAANVVLKAERLAANEWGFQGFGTAYLALTEAISEDEIAALRSGDRVLQMNIYYEYTDKEDVPVSKTPDAEAPEETVDFSFRLAEDGRRGWNFETQDSVELTIPITIDLGNRATWGAYPEGRGIQLYGTITKHDEWETVTFSTAYNSSDDPEDFVLKPRAIGDANATFVLDDENTTDENLDYMGLIFNPGFTGKPNPDGWYEVGSSDIFPIRDDHNPYYIDNIRIIDTDEFNNNPNL